MKKLLATVLILAMFCSFAACSKSKNNPVISHPEKGNETTNPSTSSQSNESESEENISSEIPSFEDVSSFDDFVEKMDNSDFKVNKTETEDGKIIIDLTTPSTDSDDNKGPAVPNIDTVKPSVPEKDEETESQPEPTPEKQPEEEEETPSEPEKKPEQKPQEETKKPVYTYTTGQKHNSVPYTKRHLYSVLDEEFKGYYRQIDKAIKNLDSKVNLATELASDSRYYIYYLYMFDNPEHFYLGSTVTILSYGKNESGFIFSYSDGEMTCRFGGELKEINDELRARIRAKQAVFNAEVERIISTIPSNAPDVVKEKLIYDRILTDSYYNLSAKWDGIAEDNWTAYGILVNKHGVCESYAEAFQTLCLAVGINCTGVIGTAGGGHKWNCVQLDGEWYMCDITFDDPIGGEQGAAYHFYFNLTSAQMIERNHSWADSMWPVPNCTATKYSYQNYFGN